MTISKTPTLSYLPLVIAGLLLAPASQSATVGPLAVRVNNDQAFVAEAPLLFETGENPANVSVRLAAPDQFDENGIAWRYEFSQLRIQTQTQIDGSKFIRISSDSNWPQNHLDLVLEINTPSGSQFIKLGAELFRPSPVSIKPPRKSGFDPHSLSQDLSHYGPVRASDTLWSIAKHVAHQHGVSTQQMLETLKKDNPEAFNHGSINSMKSGATLKIAPPEQKPEPEPKPKPEQKPEPETKPKPEQKPEPETKPEPTAEPTISPQAPAPESKALELIAPVTDPATTTKDQASEANLTGQTTTPDLAPVTPGSGEGDYLFLQTRVETLEQQIGAMQQLLTLKDQQLTELQGSVEAQLNQQTQLFVLSVVSGLLATLCIGLGWLVWRKKPQSDLAKPTEIQTDRVKISEITPVAAPPVPEKTAVTPPLPSISMQTVSTSPPEHRVANKDDHEFEFNFDLDLNPGKQRAQNNNSPTEDWTSEDNQESKIDLARAYFDMGDIEMAKEMANQVLKAGNQEQQNLAKTLLNEIDQENS